MTTEVASMNEKLVSMSTSVETMSYSMPVMTNAVVGMSSNMNRMSYDISQGTYAFTQPMSYMWGNPPQPNANVGQIIMVTTSLEERDNIRIEFQEYLEKTFVGTDALVELLAIGPAVSRPIEYRVSGPDIHANCRLRYRICLPKME